MRWSCLNSELLLLFQSVIQAIQNKREKNKEKKSQPRSLGSLLREPGNKVEESLLVTTGVKLTCVAGGLFLSKIFVLGSCLYGCARGQTGPPPPSFRPQFSFREVVFSCISYFTNHKRKKTPNKNKKPASYAS